MAGIIGKLAAFARSPQGQRAISTASRRAQEIARDPRTREKVAELRERVARRGGSGGASGSGGSAR